ncbi:MAG TPA: c-type cytochrome [Thermoanaerobaculia bacterium]|nr:c-type cytochrome [Thermoanaerobaculia bacterium]
MRANKILLLVSSLGTLALLGFAAFGENFRQEWRVLQRQYRAALPEEQRSDFAIQLRQIVAPELGVADRCVTCHVGMAPGESGVEGHPAFAPHPPVVHDPSAYGCTVCHAGQGRATDSESAHGLAAHWPAPMIPRRYASAGCGSCHTHLAVPHRAELEHGARLFERLDCLACHAVDGRGGTLRPGGSAETLGPDLSTVGAAGTDSDALTGWYDRHLARHRGSGAGPWADSFAPVAEPDRDALGVFLGSRVGAPGLIEAKALFHSLGCRGCHRVGGVGGDDGPDLARAGERDPGQTDFTHVPGPRESPRDLSAWFAEHFRSPAAVVPGSAMPALGLDEATIDRLVLYTHSLRRPPGTEALWPRDRLSAERFGEREFATDGATLYGTFCAACHGPVGQGMRFAGMPAFPAIASPDFLRAAPDELLRATIERGRPGRRMPAWGQLEGGLRPEEIDTLVSYLRELGGQPAVADPRPHRFVAADPDSLAAGERLYGAICASCHGAAGEGGEGPALDNKVLLEAATDGYLVDTITTGRAGTSMPGFTRPTPLYPTLDSDQIEAIVAWIRTWEITTREDPS